MLSTKIHLAWERLNEPSDDFGREFKVPPRPRFGTYSYLGTNRRKGRFL